MRSVRETWPAPTTSPNSRRSRRGRRRIEPQNLMSPLPSRRPRTARSRPSPLASRTGEVAFVTFRDRTMKRKSSRLCRYCRQRYTPTGAGRPPSYCSARCRVAAWRDGRHRGAHVVAALYVQSRGPYSGLRGVRTWDEVRDARRYPGPYPVVAHPPCGRWSMLADIVEKVHGYKVGDDGGCFQAAIAAVRQWGGVLEHPRLTHAWPHHDIARPPREGGWIPAGDGIGWTCEVDQNLYGHVARKRTWLYAAHCTLPPLIWGIGDSDVQVGSIDSLPPGAVRRKGPIDRFKRPMKSINGDAASRTPMQFRDLLISMARSVNMRRAKMRV